MMGKEEVFAAVVESGDDESKGNFRFKLKHNGLRYVAVEPSWEPRTKKQAKQGLEDMELENSYGHKKRRKEVMPRSLFSSSVREQRRTIVSAKKRNDELHRLLFLPGGLRDGTKLTYCVKGEDKLKGYKQGNGIVCSHCNTEISPSLFEAHAGSAKRQPYRYICTTDGHTLHEIALQLSNGQCIESIIQSSSDDECAVCGVEGGLLVCDGCSRAYHTVCLGLEGIPTRDWHCSHCTENVGTDGRNSSPVIVHPDRVVTPPVYQAGGCVVCRDQDFSVDTCDERKVMQCYQCGKQYHVGCFLDLGSSDLKETRKNIWFCCSDCESVHESMKNLLKTEKVLAVNKKLIADGSANSIHRQILSVKSSITEDLQLLRKAAAIFNECFKTLSSKTYPDLIAAMVRGKNISEWESRQIYCVVLIVDSVVSSVGVLRIISREIAEIPIVATVKRYRGKGYFRALFSCIEQLLVSVNVKKVVLPAAKDAETMWTNKLGFKKISVEQLSEYTRDFQLTMFSGTSMLEKVLDGANCESEVVQPISQLAGSSRF